MTAQWLTRAPTPGRRMVWEAVLLLAAAADLIVTQVGVRTGRIMEFNPPILLLIRLGGWWLADAYTLVGAALIVLLRAQVRTFPRVTWWGLLICAVPRLVLALAVGAQVAYLVAVYGGR